MKIRNGFVSNSSSSSFLITNESNEQKTIVDFVIENKHLIKQYIDEYESYSWSGHDPDAIKEKYSLENAVKDASSNEYFEIFDAGKQLVMYFGDEDGTVLGQMYDYILRDGGSSENFEWHFHESHR